jgi:hypothetical protein
MSEPRYRLAVCVAGGHLYATGGWDIEGRLSSMERYDPGTDSWEAVGAMSQARYDFALVAL